MRAAVVTFPGSNCDYDCYKAINDVLGECAHFVWHRETDLGDPDSGDPDSGDPDLIILPGGFSYGDYLRAGAIARFSPIMESVIRAAENGVPVLGICNGFQILCEAGLLPGALVRNRDLRFLGRDTRIRVERSDTIFTRDYDAGDVLRLPLAHGEGNYQADRATLERLEAAGQVVFRYVDEAGDPTPEANPNGSVHNIAGIINETGNVLGLMPHPERVVEALLGGTDGLALFESIRDHVNGSRAAVGRPNGGRGTGGRTGAAVGGEVRR